MASFDMFVHVENIKRYRALLERETDARQRSTLQSLVESEEAALKTDKNAPRAIRPRATEPN
jgi:hypothetical protein